MSWQQETDLGTELVAHIHSALKVDQKYCVNYPRGFEWWPSDYKQKIWADTGIYHNAETVYRVHAEIDLLRGKGHLDQCEVFLSHVMEKGVMSALIYDAQEDVFRLHASLYASADNQRALEKLFMAAAALQLSYAHKHAKEFADLLHGAAATSAHPNSGLRTEKYAMLHMDDQFFKPAGQIPSRWIGVPEWHEASQILERLADFRETDEKTSLRAKFKFGGALSELEVTTEHVHPELGNGLHLMLILPMHLEEHSAAHTTLELNGKEGDNSEWTWNHFLGSWCCHEDQLAFTCFVPNISYNSEALIYLTQGMGRRALWIDELFERGFERSTSAMH